ncbi:unnamed protein product, partial [Rhizoctonia solani]
MRYNIWSFTAFAVVVLADSAKHRSINPPLSSVRHVDFASLPAAEPATNGERLAQGLPLMRPRSRKSHRAGAYHDDDKASLKRATRAASAPNAARSTLPPVQKSCNVLAKAGGTTIGFLRRDLNMFGEYGLFQTGQADALEVSFSYLIGSTLSFNLRPTNGVTQAFPYVGGAISAPSDNNDFGPGKDHYAYLVATTQTPPRSPPVAGDNSYSMTTGTSSVYESEIWTYDPVTTQIRPQWVNADGWAPTTYLLYANDGSDAVLITGDPATLNRNFETSYPVI